MEHQCLSFTATRTASNNLYTVLCNVQTPDRTCMGRSCRQTEVGQEHIGTDAYGCTWLRIEASCESIERDYIESFT